MGHSDSYHQTGRTALIGSFQHRSALMVGVQSVLDTGFGFGIAQSCLVVGFDSGSGTVLADCDSGSETAAGFVGIAGIALAAESLDTVQFQYSLEESLAH